MTASRSNWTGVALGLTLASYAAYQQFKMPPALPLMLDAYGYDSRLAGAFMSAYAVAGLLLSLVLGRVIAQRGSGGPAAAALALTVVGSVATMLVPESGALVLAARVLEGVGFAVLAIAGPVLANANASARHLPLVIAGTAAWIPIGQLVAVLSAGPLFRLAGWPGLWWLGLAMAAALALWLAAIRAGRWVDLGGRRATAGGADEGRAAPGLDQPQKLALALTGLVFMLWSAQYFAYMTWLPQYLVSALGLSVEGALRGYALPVGVLLLSILATGQLLSRGAAPGVLLVGGLAAQALTWAALPFVGGGWLGAASLVLYGAGGGVVPTCLFAMPSRIAGRGDGAARAFGIMMTGRNSGVLIGPILLAQTFELAGSWDWAAPVMGTATAVALVVAVWLASKVRGADA